MRVHLTIGDILDLIKYGAPQVGSPRGACQCRRCKRLGFDPWAGKIPWRRKWQPTPVFLPWKSHGQRSLAGKSPGVTRVRHDLATKQQQKSHQSKPEAEEYSSGHLWTLLVTFRVELETF